MLRLWSDLAESLKAVSLFSRATMLGPMPRLNLWNMWKDTVGTRDGVGNLSGAPQMPHVNVLDLSVFPCMCQSSMQCCAAIGRG